MLRQRDIRRRFDRAAPGFDNVDFVHAVTRDGLLARLEPLVLEARTILDLGSATGATGRLLRGRFRRAHVVCIDLSNAMLAAARRDKPWLARSSFVQADALQLPFANGSFDLVVANQLLPWLPEPDPAFAEVARVLKKGGLFAFATLGPDSLRELREAWASIDDAAHVNPFPDMHDVGDGLVRAGLCDPVLDVDRLAVRYENVGKLLEDLTRTGARNALVGRSRGLTGRRRLGQVKATLENATPGPGLSLELELVYGHCWGNGPRSAPGSVHIDANSIPLRR